jgi:hypothetical protein
LPPEIFWPSPRIRCLAYIDLNMVRAGVVRRPCEWLFGGYNKIQKPKQRYSLINRRKLTALPGIKDYHQLSDYHRNWVEEVLKSASNRVFAPEKGSLRLKNDYLWQALPKILIT